MNFREMDLERIEFCGGPACGRRYTVAKVREVFVHEDEAGRAHEYVCEPEPHGGVWTYIHAGIVEARR